MKLDQPKQYLHLGGVPILLHTARAFIENPHIQELIVVVPADRIKQTSELFKQYHIQYDGLRIVAGGKRRQDSVLNGLRATSDDCDIVLIHDGARPLVSQAVIDRCYNGAITDGAVIAAVPVKDTLKKIEKNSRISGTIDRSNLYQAQTPQAFRKELLVRAYQQNGEEDVTDESSLLEKATIPVTIVEGSETNLKITRPEDLALAEQIITNSRQPDVKIGHGYDAHRFAEQRPLVLGGVTIEHSHGLAGHSDADVLTHALCDALLGALGAGDIGKHFPDSDDAFKNIYSIKLLKKVIQFSADKGYTLSNADITVVCQAPRLAQHIEKMRALLAKTCKTELQHINIKATTTEKVGFTGRKEGISCHAVVLLQSCSN